MNIFLVYDKSANDQAHDDKWSGGSNAQIIKSGLNLPGLIFGYWWMLYHQIWIFFAPIFLANAALIYTNNHSFAAFLQLSSCVFVFLFSEEIRAFDLKRQGYEFSEVICAKTSEEAQYKYIDKKTKHDTKSSRNSW